MLAVVVLGTLVSASSSCITPEVEKFLHQFWHMLAYLANTVIFILVGMVITDYVASNIQGMDWIFIGATYLAALVIRSVQQIKYRNCVVPINTIITKWYFIDLISQIYIQIK